MIRAVLLALLIPALALTAGCARGVSGDGERAGVVHVGRDAADVDRGRAHVYAEEIASLLSTRKELLLRRRQLLQDEADCNRKAAAVRRETALSGVDRERYVKQYLSFAAERRKQADRLLNLIKAYNEQIARLDGKRRDRLRRSDSFDQIVVPAP